MLHQVSAVRKTVEQVSENTFNWLPVDINRAGFLSETHSKIK